MMFVDGASLRGWMRALMKRLRGIEGRLPPVRRRPEVFDGVIVAEGPLGEPDYTDHRYWVARAIGPAETSEQLAAAELGEMPTEFPLQSGVEGVSSLPGYDLARIVTATNWAERVRGVVSEADATEAVPAGAAKGSHMLPVGTVVRVETVWDRADPRRERYVIRSSSPHVLYPVKVTKTGGSAGDETTTCTFVYTVTDLYGVELGRLMEPVKGRPIGPLLPPADGSYGLGFWDEEGAFRLWDPNEVLDSGECEE